jgi:hypothetical protein
VLSEVISSAIYKLGPTERVKNHNRCPVSFIYLGLFPSSMRKILAIIGALITGGLGIGLVSFGSQAAHAYALN